MKVKALRKLLSSFPDNSEVILAADAEGNSFSPLDEVTCQNYVETSTYSGEIIEEKSEDSVVVCTLWPTN